jgi:hypothetical protein
MGLFNKKKVEEAPVLPKLSKEKELDEVTPTVKVDGKVKSTLQQPVQSLAETLMAEYRQNYGSVTDDDQKNMLFAIYAECRLNRDILMQILNKQ